MSYQVLARKWRPKSFAELVGQQHVVQALVHALDENRLHQAYLLTGTRGVGKTTIARIMAKALNCEAGISSTPCNICQTCVEIDKGRFIDLVELDAASNTQVENMRELLENAQYAPSSGRYKVYIIDEVHMLSKSAFNAMLKTLEEPPPHVKFILATTDPQKIPVTVLSRCLQFNLKQMSAALIAEHLQLILREEAVVYDAPATKLLAYAAAGSMRDALSLLDQAIAHGGGKLAKAPVREMLGAVDQTYLFGLLRALHANDGPTLIREIDQMAARSISFERALQDLATLLHRITLAQTVPAAAPDADVWDYENLMQCAQFFSAETIQLFYQIAILGRRDLNLAPDEYAGFSMTLLRMLAFTPATTLPTIVTPPSSPSSRAEAPKRDVPVATLPVDSPSEPLEPPDKPAARTFSGDWLAVINELKLTGVAKMFAQHCELKSFSENKIELCVPTEQRHFMEKSFQEKLRASIREYFGGGMRVSFSLGTVNGLSAAQIERDAQAEEQRQAVASVMADPFVRDLVEKFDAEIIESSIQPIKKEGN